MPRGKKVYGGQRVTKPSFTEKKVVCGHEEVVHAVDCKQCWQVEKRFCGKKWYRCGGHGVHIELDCQELCTSSPF